MGKRIFFALIGLGLATASARAQSSVHESWAGGGVPDDCRQAADRAVQALRIPGGARMIWVDRTCESDEQNSLYWYAIPGCEKTGYLNVRVDFVCNIAEVFTRYGCRIPGVTHYPL